MFKKLFKDTKLNREAVFEQLKIDEGVVNESKTRQYEKKKVG